MIFGVPPMMMGRRRAAITGFVGANAAAATSVALPPHQPGDLLLMAAVYDVNTGHSLPSGWTSVRQDGVSGLRMITARRTAASSGEASGTWSNAVGLLVSVYRGYSSIAIRAVASAGSSNVVAYPAATPTTPPMVMLAHAAHSHGAANTHHAPSDMLNRAAHRPGGFNGYAVGLHDTDIPVASRSLENVAAGFTGPRVAQIFEMVPS